MVCDIYLSKAVIQKEIKENKPLELGRGEQIFWRAQLQTRPTPGCFYMSYFIQALQQPARRLHSAHFAGEEIETQTLSCLNREAEIWTHVGHPAYSLSLKDKEPNRDYLPWLFLIGAPDYLTMSRTPAFLSLKTNLRHASWLNSLSQIRCLFFFSRWPVSLSKGSARPA